MTLGAYPEVSLAEARGRRDEARLLLRDGKNPIEERKKAHQVEREKLEAEDTFGKAAREYVEKCRRDDLVGVTLLKKE